MHACHRFSHFCDFYSYHSLHPFTMTVIDKVKNAVHSSDSSSQQPPAAAQMGHAQDSDKLPELPEQPAFDHEKITVIFVLGGPGAGEVGLSLSEPTS